MATKQLAKFAPGAVPAHLKSLAPSEEDREQWDSGTVSSFPVLSLSGKRFTMRSGDDEELIRKPDDPEEPETRLMLVVLRANKGVARTYYEEAYQPGSDDPPTCYSNDGIIPAADVEDRQAKKCAVCKWSQWGSRITDSGARGKACSEVKRLAVALLSDLGTPMLLRLPPTSLKNWDQYVRELLKRGVSPTQVVTQVRFDTKVEHQLLKFEPKMFVTEELLEEMQEALEHPSIDNIIGAAFNPDMGSADDEDESDEEEEAPPPRRTRKKPPAKKPAKPAVEDDDDDDSEEEDTPPPAPRKKAPAKKAPAKKTPPPPDDDDGSDVDAEDEDDGLGLGDLDLDSLDFGDDEDDD
jgi:hypothetical protein